MLRSVESGTQGDCIHLDTFGQICRDTRCCRLTASISRAPGRRQICACKFGDWLGRRLHAVVRRHVEGDSGGTCQTHVGLPVLAMPVHPVLPHARDDRGRVSGPETWEPHRPGAHRLDKQSVLRTCRPDCACHSLQRLCDRGTHVDLARYSPAEAQTSACADRLETAYPRVFLVLTTPQRTSDSCLSPCSRIAHGASSLVPNLPKRLPGICRSP